MNNSPILLVGGFLAAGLVGGLAATILAPTPQTAQTSESLLPTAAATATAADLDALNAEVQRLTDRLDMIESGGALSLRTPEGDLPQAVTTDQLEEAVAAVIAKNVDSSSMTSLVAGTLENIRAQEEAERDIQREQRRVDRLQDRVDRLTEQLGLYPDQASAMLDVLDQQDTKRDELRDEIRSGGLGMTDMRDGFQAIQEETNTAVQGILTPEQFATYTLTVTAEPED